jgi:hypothetical protein
LEPQWVAKEPKSSATRPWPRTFGRNVNTASVRCGEQITAADRSGLALGGVAIAARQTARQVRRRGACPNSGATSRIVSGCTARSVRQGPTGQPHLKCQPRTRRGLLPGPLAGCLLGLQYLFVASRASHVQWVRSRLCERRRGLGGRKGP